MAGRGERLRGRADAPGAAVSFVEREDVDGLAGCERCSGLAAVDAPESGGAGTAAVDLALRAVGRAVLA